MARNEASKKTVAMKCKYCVCGIEIPEGIWCLKFKGISNEEMAEQCQEFVHKKYLGL